MTERDIERIEKKLDLQLPDHYKTFLLEHTKTIAALKKKDKFAPFFTTAKQIIDANQGLRADPARQPTNEDKDPWPLKYLIVGTNGGGDYWCVDLTKKREIIWFFDSEAHGTFRHAEPSTWTKAVDRYENPPPRDFSDTKDYLCKMGKPGPDAKGDGSFTLIDTKKRTWLIWEKKPTPSEDILARIRGTSRGPSWIGDQDVIHVIATDENDLLPRLSME